MTSVSFTWVTLNTTHTMSSTPQGCVWSLVALVLMDCKIECFATFHAGYQINTVSFTGNWLYDGICVTIDMGSTLKID